MKTRFGTSYFVSFDAAFRYYNQPFNGPSPLATVQRKINEGEINIGPPPTKPGDEVSVIPGEGRYQISRES